MEVVIDGVGLKVQIAPSKMPLCVQFEGISRDTQGVEALEFGVNVEKLQLLASTRTWEPSTSNITDPLDIQGCMNPPSWR